MGAKPSVLLVNPHIEDFAAYDHFSKPLGLLRLAAYLRDQFQVCFANALTRHHPFVKTEFHFDGTGNFPKTVIEKPAALRDIPRYFKRYGLSDTDFLEMIRGRVSEPDFVFMTSGMTYWYTGVRHTIGLVRTAFPRAKILLGGPYAALTPEHARQTPGADHVVPFQELSSCLDALEKILGEALPRDERIPAYDLLGEYDYAPVLTSVGCVFDCSYCAGRFLSGFRQFSPDLVADAILRLNRNFGVRHFAFYDDALLVNSENHLDPILERVIRGNLSIRFYTPNGLHIRYLTSRTAGLMRRAGFADVRLSLESADPAFQSRGPKTTNADFENGMDVLLRAGFTRGQVRVYTMLNAPGLDPDSVEPTMRFIHDRGGLPVLSFYSPIPGTPDFEKVRAVTDVDEPLFQNNTVYLYRAGFNLKKLERLKKLEQDFRRTAENG